MKHQLRETQEHCVIRAKYIFKEMRTGSDRRKVDLHLAPRFLRLPLQALILDTTHSCFFLSPWQQKGKWEQEGRAVHAFSTYYNNAISGSVRRHVRLNTWTRIESVRKTRIYLQEVSSGFNWGLIGKRASWHFVIFFLRIFMWGTATEQSPGMSPIWGFSPGRDFSCRGDVPELGSLKGI